MSGELARRNVPYLALPQGALVSVSEGVHLSGRAASRRSRGLEVDRDRLPRRQNGLYSDLLTSS